MRIAAEKKRKQDEERRRKHEEEPLPLSSIHVIMSHRWGNSKQSRNAMHETCHKLRQPHFQQQFFFFFKYFQSSSTVQYFPSFSKPFCHNIQPASRRCGNGKRSACAARRRSNAARRRRKSWRRRSGSNGKRRSSDSERSKKLVKNHVFGWLNKILMLRWLSFVTYQLLLIVHDG